MVRKKIKSNIIPQKLFKQSYSYHSTINSPRNNLSHNQSNISILSLEDYSRIRQNAGDSQLNLNPTQRKINLKQKEFQLSKARSHIKSMIEFDLKNSIYYKGNMTSRAQENKNKKILLFAKECKENELDLTKKMNQLLKYAKDVSVRDEQKKKEKKNKKRK